jgi:spermidine synthase
MTADALVSLHLGSPFQHPERVATLLGGLRAAFAVVRPLAAYVPLYGSLWLMAIASDALDPDSPDLATLQARTAARGLEDLRYYDAQLHTALLKAPYAARDKLGEFLQL